MMIASYIGASPDPAQSSLPFGNRIGSLITALNELEVGIHDFQARFASGDSGARQQAVALARLSDELKTFKEGTLQPLISNLASRNETSVSRAESEFASLFNRFHQIDAASQVFWTTPKIAFAAAVVGLGAYAFWRRRNA